MAEDKAAPKFDFKALGVPVGPPQTPPNQKSMLIYGPPGSGKTRLAASASAVPDLSRVALLDLEAGSVSIETSPDVDTDNIDVFRPEDWAGTRSVLEALLNEEHDYQTVVIDTVGKMMEFMFPEKQKRNPRDGFALWRELAEDTIRFAELLHRSGMNVIILAHTDEEKNEKTGVVKVYPYFLGQKTGKEAPKIFDLIAYLYVDEDEDGYPMRILQTEGIGDIVAKDRTDTLPVLLGQPTMEKMYGYIKSGIPGKGRKPVKSSKTTK